MLQILQFLLILITLLFSPSFESLGNQGACQSNEIHRINLSKAQFQETWFLQSVSASYFFQSANDKCSTISFNSDSTFSTIENKILDFNNQSFYYSGVSILAQPGALNILYNDFKQETVSFEFIYINEDSSVSVLKGCNSSNFLGSSDILILTREQIPNLDEIQKGREETERKGFDTSDLVSKNTTGCSQLL